MTRRQLPFRHRPSSSWSERRNQLSVFLLVVMSVGLVWTAMISPWSETAAIPVGRQEVIFWHFWGGADRENVDDVVRRFNESQSTHFVRSIAMPGSNLDMKLFLAVTGGDPPDVVNQDDPIVADWASRGAIVSLSSVAEPGELQTVQRSLFPAARALGTVDHQLFALCNGLDIRALFYNEDLLRQFGLTAPQSINDLDTIAETIAPTSDRDQTTTYGFLPNPRNLWCWGFVYGGRFYDPTRRRITLDDPGVVAALQWMAGYGQRYGTAAVSLRARDQSLPGKSFPLLANRYAVTVDGQWRIRDIESFQEEQCAAKVPVTLFGVCPLPTANGQPPNSGWINGNFFIIPAGATNKPGAWEFMKFWSGLDGHAVEAATTCVNGGWIPVTQEVVDQPAFQDHLKQQPLWATFVNLAADEHQQPRPNIRSALKLDREVRAVAERAMYGGSTVSIADLLQAASERLNEQAR